MKKRNITHLAALLLACMVLLCACMHGESGTTGYLGTTVGTTNGSTNGTTNPDGTVVAPVQPTTPPEPTCDHKDENNDGICDSCKGTVVVILDFYAINDLHGVFMDSGSNSGVDELTTYIKNAYADDRAYEILLSSGDMWQGTVESSSNKGSLMTEWMNDMDFVSMTLGNHEFDWGSDCIASNADLAQFPFLGINVKDSNVETPYCQDSVVVERGGVKIGIIGAIGNCLSSISGEFSDGLEFITGSALTELVKAESTRLRQQGCDLIVYSVHAGVDEYDAQLSNGYVDLVFEAHTHSRYVDQDSYGVYHIQAGSSNSNLGYASICYNTANDLFSVQTVSTLNSSVYADAELADDPIVEELFDKYFPDENPYTHVIGYNDRTKNSNTITDLVAQLYLQKAQELWGDEYEIVLGGGFLKCRTPYKVPAGDVTYSQLYSILPFDNDLVLCKVSGKQLKKIFVETSNTNYHCAYDPNLKIEDDQSYYVVTDTYTSFYKYNLPSLTEVERLENYYARDLLKDFIAQGNWA